MNCAQVREALPGLLYGHLEGGTAAAVENHLAQCPDCRRERAALQSVRSALDRLPPSVATVDLSQIYREAAERAARQTTRWRRTAVVFAAAAAILVAVTVAGRVQVRLDAHHLSVRWGPAETVVITPAAPDLPERTGPADAEAHLRLLTELIHGLASDAEGRDRRHQEELARIHQDLQRHRRELDGRFDKVERHLAAVDALQVILSQKGAAE
jgi:anti-sigma factor RsiW